MKPQVFENLDANESVFFSRELTSIESQTYDILYPEYRYSQFLPVTSKAGAGAESILYRQYDRVGMMKLISNYANDLPRSDVKGKEFLIAIKSIGGSFGYNIQEIRNAAMAGRPLEAMRAQSARDAYEQYVNTLAWLGDGTSNYGGMYGLLFTPNTTKTTPTTGAWNTATADQILADFAKVYGEMQTATKSVEIPNTCLVRPAVYTRLATMPRSTVSDTTVLEFLQKAYPLITFDWLNELELVTSSAGLKPSGTAGSANCLVLYRKDPRKVRLELPSPFEMFQPQLRGLEYIVPTHARVAGVIAYYPLSISIMENV